MQFVHDGPDIPGALLQAQEEGRLAFFCGSGVSMPDGLPNFEGLLRKVYDALASEPTALEQSEIDRGALDRAFTLLEGDDRFGSKQVRRAVHRILTPAETAKADLHKILLRLARTRDGALRLVTTNFDRLFEAAEPMIPVAAAPRLPVPKPGKWREIVYLHGRLGDVPDDPQDVILTSADFGVAYLVERWAARFVCELFANLAVVFVGYSGNDPVMRYLIDALSAERVRGGHVHRAYAFEGASPDDEARKAERWRASGIEPVVYSNVDQHRLLHESLRAWAATWTAGLQSRVNIVKTAGRVAPSSLPAETVSQFCWALREESGAAARAFAGLGDDSRPEWFEVLKGEGLFADRAADRTVALVDDGRMSRQAGPLGPVASAMAEWIGWRAGRQEMLRAVLDAGAVVHPNVAWAIRAALRRGGFPGPLAQAWRLVLWQSEQVRPNHFELLEDLEQFCAASWSPILRQRLLSVLHPDLSCSAPTLFPGEDTKQPDRDVDRLVRVEVGLALRADDCSYWLDRISKRSDWPQILVDIAPDLVALLSRAVDLRAAAGLADAEDDGSTAAQPSIAPHAQNRHFDTWSWLVELQRDAFDAAIKSRPDCADTLAALWLQRPWPVFRRLAMYGAMAADVPSLENIAERMLAGPPEWLWARGLRPEVYRAFTAVWRTGDGGRREALATVLLAGPPRPAFLDEEEEWNRYRDGVLWRFLARLRFIGEALTPALEQEWSRLQSVLGWRYEGTEREDHDYWIEVSSGVPTDLKVDDLARLDDEKLWDVLTNHESNREGLLHEWRQLVARQPSIGVAHLEHLSRAAWMPRDSGQSTLLALATAGSTDEWRTRAVKIVMSDRETLVSIFSDILPDVLRHVARPWPDALAEDILNLCRMLVDVYLQKPAGDQPEADYVSRALNRPSGRLVEVVFNIIGTVEKDQGLPEQALSVLERLISMPGMHGRLARAMAASRVAPLLLAAPEWASRVLIPRFDFVNVEDARAAWQGFLWQPWLSERVWRALEPHVLGACRHASSLGDPHDRGRLGQVIGWAALEGWLAPDLGRSCLRALDDEGRAGLIVFWQTSLSGAADRAPALWRDQIAPWLQSAWPKEPRLRGPSVSRQLACAAVDAGLSFPDAVKAICSLITEIGDGVDVVLRKMSAASVVLRYPRATVDLLNGLTPDRISEWIVPDMTATLDQARSADGSIEQDPAYRRLREVVLRSQP